MSGPATVWQPNNNGEMGLQDPENITTLSGLSLITLSGNSIVTKESTYTKIPATIWTQNDGA